MVPDDTFRDPYFLDFLGLKDAYAERDLEEPGAVFVIGITISFPELPFGGIKRSGDGRELSIEGIREFCNLKTVWVA